MAAAMAQEVFDVYPWATLFLNSTADQAGRELDEWIDEMDIEDHEERMRLHKLVDRMRRGQ